MNPAGCRVAVLGPVQVARSDGSWSEVPGVNGKALVVALVLARGQVVSVPALVDDIWQDEPPQNGKAALQTIVSRVRAAAGDELIESVSGGYRLGIPPEQVDLWAPDAARRGEPGADLGALELAERLRRTADTARATHLAARAEAELGSGQAAAAVTDARLLANAAPYDEEAQLLLMRALAASGRQGDALRSFAGFRERLADELGTDPGDALIAYNVELLRQEQAAQARAEADAAAGAVPGRAAARTVGLRAAPNALLGRDADLAAIERLMAQSRLTTILGAGGLGKTRLAQELAHRATARFDQVVVVELASIREPEDVPLAVASALGVGETSGGRLRLTEPLVLLEVRSRIVTALGERSTLLVLDNCEHVVEAAASLVGEILAAIPSVTVLATSRAPLQIGAESVYPLEPLAADERGAAVQLFLERARAARPGAVLPLEVVARLCARLDGLPLAIELAAARIRSMSVDEVEKRLGNRFALLTGGDRSAPERHRTLIAVIDWSWNLLDDEQRRLLRRLSRFPDGFSADAAAAVAGGDPLRAADALDALVGQSLVGVGETEDGDARYRMLETVREFGEMALVDAGEERLVAEATATWARAFALDTLASFPTPQQALGIRRIELEYENLLGALRRAVAPGTADPDVVHAVFAVLALYWMVHNQIGEALAFVWPVAQAVRTAPIADEATDAGALTLLVMAVMGIASGQLRDASVGPGGAAASDERFPLPPEARAEGLRTGLRFAVRLRRLARERAVGPWIQAVVRLLGAARSQQRAFEELTALRAFDDQQVAMLANLFSGLFTENTGDTEAATAFVHAAYESARRFGSTMTMAQAAQNLANLASQGDEPEEALRWAAESRARFAEVHAVEEERQLEWVVALSRLKLGQHDGAAEAFERFTTDEGDQPGFDQFDLRAIGWAGLAELAAAEGEVDRAIELYRRGEAVFAEAPQRMQRLAPWSLIVSAGSLARTVLAGRVDEAARLGARALRRTTRVAYRVRDGQQADRPVIGAALLGLSTWLLAERDDATDAERDAGLRLFALAEGLRSRQDQPALRRALHEARVVAVCGAEALAAVRAEVTALELEERTTAAMELLAGIRI